MEPLAILGICAITLIVGFLLGLAVGKSGTLKKSDEVDQAREELKQYREEVSAHFGKTAAHFQTLGKNYRELYEHMASGAGALFEGDDAGKAVAFASMEQLLAADRDPTDVTPPSADEHNEPETQDAATETEQTSLEDTEVADTPDPSDPPDDAATSATDTVEADSEVDAAVSDSNAFAEEKIDDLASAIDARATSKDSKTSA